LDARKIYTNLSKLALALEKNLLITSTLTICTDPYLQATTKVPVDQEKANEKQNEQSDPAPSINFPWPSLHPSPMQTRHQLPPRTLEVPFSSPTLIPHLHRSQQR